MRNLTFKAVQHFKVPLELAVTKSHRDATLDIRTLMFNQSRLISLKTRASRCVHTLNSGTQHSHTGATFTCPLWRRLMDRTRALGQLFMSHWTRPIHTSPLTEVMCKQKHESLTHLSVDNMKKILLFSGTMKMS